MKVNITCVRPPHPLAQANPAPLQPPLAISCHTSISLMKRVVLCPKFVKISKFKVFHVTRLTDAPAAPNVAVGRNQCVNLLFNFVLNFILNLIENLSNHCAILLFNFILNFDFKSN